jgi:hypothetical protein
MPAQIVPLTNQPNQGLVVALAIDAGTTTLQLDISYSEIAQYWLMAISDRNGNLLVDSIPMLTGYYPAANLLCQFVYLGIGSAYILNASGVAMDYPNSTNLGTDFLLLWDDTPGYVSLAAAA